MTAQSRYPAQLASNPWPDAPRDFGHGDVSDWMGPIGETVAPSTPLDEAIRVMLASDDDHLIVIDAEGGLAGIVGYRALVGLIADGTYGGPDTIESLINGAPATVSQATPFAATLRLLDPPEVTCVVVVHEGRPVGLVSEAHLVPPTLALVASSL